MCEHIGYEANNLFVCGTAVVAMADRPPSQEKNVVLAAYLLHARNLLGFLVASDSPWENDVFAYDYFPGGQGGMGGAVLTRRYGRALGMKVSEVYSHISTRIGHVGLQRLVKVSWLPQVIASGLGEAFYKFLKAVSPEYRSAIQVHLAPDLRQPKIWLPVPNTGLTVGATGPGPPPTTTVPRAPKPRKPSGPQGV